MESDEFTFEPTSYLGLLEYFALKVPVLLCCSKMQEREKQTSPAGTSTAGG